MRTASPTRHRFHRIQDRIELARRGLDLLERKLDGLVLEFMDIFEQYQSKRGSLQQQFQTAQDASARIRATEGQIALDGIAWAREQTPRVTVSSKNIMGVRIPQFESTSIISSLDDRGYGMLGTDSLIDEAVDRFEALLEQLVVVAEIESAIQRLLREIERTNRRVNALEKSILPRLTREKRYIERWLEEREREEHIRQKWVKELRERHRRHEGT